jgi:hypothetical protein
VTTLAQPPASPEQHELEAVIREARARQRKRQLGAAALVAVVAGTVLAIHSIATGTHPSPAVAGAGGAAVTGSGYECGVRVVGTRIFDGEGTLAYRDPSKSAMWHELQCSGTTVWVIFGNGVGTMHEEYVGVRSLDRGRTWRVAFAENPGVHPRYGVGAEVGPWRLVGRRAAYFVGTCPACGNGRTTGTVSLSVTKDGGRTFQRYAVPAPAGFEPLRLRVTGNVVAVLGRKLVRKINSPPFEVYRHKVVTVRVP